MKYQVGDRIVLLHSGEEGRITDFINREMVMVEVQGVSFPVFMDQIDFPYFRDFTRKTEQQKPAGLPKRRIEDIRPEKQATQTATEPGVFLNFLPVFDKDVFDDDVVSYFRISLVNGLRDTLHFTYRLFQSGVKSFELTNELRQGADFYLHDIPLEDMNGAPRLCFSLSLPHPGPDRSPSIEVQHRVKARQLFDDMDEMRQSNRAHFTYSLVKDWPAPKHEPSFPMGGTTAARPGPNTRKPAQPPQTVVDLHIEKLIQEWRSLPNHEILAIQLAAFEKAYEAIIDHRQPMLTVIHGVGKGVLRDEIHERLRSKREVSGFVNQYHPLFGYGATEIHLRY
jgi:DNA-nicking Smr family endonuclease